MTKMAMKPTEAMNAAAGAMTEAARIGGKLLAGSELFVRPPARHRRANRHHAEGPGMATGQGEAVPLPPVGRAAGPRAVLLAYGLIGRWTMTDLQDNRSLVRNLLNLGVDLYVVDWDNPSPADRYLTLDDYICGYLGGCVDEIARRAGLERVNLLGVCEGGVFTACYAALEPRPAVRGYRWLIGVNGSLSGEFMSAVFNLMTPMRTMYKYNLDLLEVVDDEKRLLNWLRMEKWIADHPDHPGEAAKQWLKDLYQQNKLILNELELNGRRVDLSRITMPVSWRPGHHCQPTQRQ